jgi:cystathionine gamma-synthase/cystathionine gamma-lyase
LKVIDIKRLAKITREKKVLLAVDNTFASPYFQNPIALGADVVVHSTTKYINGHSDIVGGAVVVNDEAIYNQLKFYQNAAGAVPGPWDCWLTLRGVRTLAVRMREHESNAQYLAKFLSKHKKVAKVYYPGLKGTRGYKIASGQMLGFGGMLSFEIKGDFAAVEKFFSGLKIFLLAESLGGVESLVCYPAKMTHGSMPEKERLKRGIKNNLIRVSIGLENKEDLKDDLEQALLQVT